MWFVVTLGAATAQTLRNALARGLTVEVSPWLNSWARFSFNLPYAALLASCLGLAFGWPTLTAAFLGWCFLTALTQLLANVALITAFRRASFAESIILHKLEVVFAALLGVSFFREYPSATGWTGIVLCGAGVALINLGRRSGLSGWRRALHMDAGALLSIFSGLLLVLTSFYLKRAASELVSANSSLQVGSFQASVHTLVHTVWMEVAMLTLYIRVRLPGEFAKVTRHLRHMILIGTSGFAASLCWFWAYTLTLVAYVKAVGQFEAVLSVLLSVLVFRERDVRRQLPGMLLISLGILLVVWT